MTLEKAIELLTNFTTYGKEDLIADEHDAIKLGIEALKYLNAYRYYSGGHWPSRIPGETKE